MVNSIRRQQSYGRILNRGREGEREGERGRGREEERGGGRVRTKIEESDVTHTTPLTGAITPHYANTSRARQRDKHTNTRKLHAH